LQAFEEPYQAIKFVSKEDVYKYLSTKYQDYTGEGLAKPFWVKKENIIKISGNGVISTDDVTFSHISQ